MLKNYFITSLRNIRKHKLYSVINISSLSLGLAACMMIFLFIEEEQSFDAFHERSDRIYRLDEVQSFPGTNTQNVALSMSGMGPNLLADFPEVENYARYWGRTNVLYQYENIRLTIESSPFVDSTFLSIFDYEIILGDRATALNEPNSMLLTAETAGKFFSSNDEAIGQQITIGDNLYKVTGILANVPENTHLQFDALRSMTTVTSDEPEFNNRWGSNFLVTYLQLVADADIDNMAKKYPDFLLKFMPAGPEQERDVNENYKLYLQPLKEVHLASSNIEHDYHNYRKFNGQYISVFIMVAIFILLIATVNFMNLTNSRAIYRSKEVGVRKTVGALKSQLFGQFVVETTMMSLISFLLAIAVSLLFLPLLSTMISRPLSFGYFLSSPMVLVIIMLITIGLGLISGIYPALYMASFKTIHSLKGTGVKGQKSIFQRIMVVLQFGLAIAMIISTLVVIQQLFFLKNKDIGFTKDQIMLVPMNETANNQFDNIKNSLNESSNILGVTASGQRLGNNFHQWGFRLRTDTAVLDMTPSNVHVDFDYLDVYEIELVDGRTFNKEIATDDGMAFIINEAFAKEIGLENPVGTAAGHSWYHEDSLGAIIGVAKDFNFNSLHYRVNTLSMVVHSDWGYDELSVKINAANINQAIVDVEKVWSELVPDRPFDYTFLDAHFEELYRSEDQMGKVVSIIAVLAILIACMGLFGLAAIAMEQRVKEIGIRKVLGASVSQLVLQLSASFAFLVVVAFVVFSPLTSYLLGMWLENFAFHVSLSIWIFVIGGVMALLIALATISFHTFRSARSNPVDTLRYE
jgi:putative ABC transport system permease protein